jgi:glutaredoxin-related protein
MAQWIPFPGSLAGVDDLETYKMLIYTFTDVFPYVYVRSGFHDVGMHVLGSLDPLEGISMDRLKKRLSKEVITDISEWDTVPLAYFQGIRRLKPPDYVNEMITTDDQPYLEFYLLRTWKNDGKKRFSSNFW